MINSSTKDLKLGVGSEEVLTKIFVMKYKQIT